MLFSLSFSEPLHNAFRISQNNKVKNLILTETLNAICSSSDGGVSPKTVCFVFTVPPCALNCLKIIKPSEVNSGTLCRIADDGHGINCAYNAESETSLASFFANDTVLEIIVKHF